MNLKRIAHFLRPCCWDREGGTYEPHHGSGNLRCGLKETKTFLSVLRPTKNDSRLHAASNLCTALKPEPTNQAYNITNQSFPRALRFEGISTFHRHEQGVQVGMGGISR